MKNFIRSMCCIFLLGIFSVQAATTNDVADKETIKKNKKVNAKCHVTLVDGSEAIIFWKIQPEKLSELNNTVVGKRISTQKSLKKIKVYRAFQCVLDGDDFTSPRARSLDEKTPR
jgi:hypothetical protein